MHCYVFKVYQRAVITPIIGIETLWKDYIAFEQSINTIIGKFILSFHSLNQGPISRWFSQIATCLYFVKGISWK